MAENETKKDIRHIEYQGYKADVDMDVLDDVRFLELTDEVMKSDTGLIPLMRFVFGEDGYEKMKAYFVKKEGRLKISTLGEIYGQLFNQVPPKA